MAQSRAKTKIFEDYHWPKPELSALARLSALLPPAFFGTDQVFRGTVTLPGSPSVQNTFELPDEWTAALSGSVASAELELRSSDYLRSLNVTANPGENRFQMRMTVSIDSTEQARALAQAIEDELGLEPESMAESRAKTKIFEDYHWPKPELSALVRLPALLPPAFFGTDQVFRGTVTLPGSPSVQNTFELPDEWTAALSGSVASAPSSSFVHPIIFSRSTLPLIPAKTGFECG
jgi:hypothetical protein